MDALKTHLNNSPSPTPTAHADYAWRTVNPLHVEAITQSLMSHVETEKAAIVMVMPGQSLDGVEIRHPHQLTTDTLARLKCVG